MVFGDGESLTPAYKKSDRQTLPECGMVWLSRFRSVLNVWQVSWTAIKTPVQGAWDFRPGFSLRLSLQQR